MSKQLKELHADCAQHHVEMAKCHDAMAKADMGDDSNDFHSKCRDSHTRMAEAFLKCAKAMDTDELDKTMRVRAFEVDDMFKSLVEIDQRDEENR